GPGGGGNLHRRDGGGRGVRRRAVPDERELARGVRSLAQPARRASIHRRGPFMKFRSDPSQLRGSLAPVVTPFTEDGEVDHDSLRDMVRWQLANGSQGISIGGSTGEPSAQSLTERAEAIRTVAQEVGDSVPFLPGTGSAQLEETLELT